MSRSHQFHAVHVERTGELQLPFPLRHIFPLFSPEGERAWVPDWDPEYLHPDHPSITAGTAFRTRHNGEETLWLILEYDPATASATYGRFSPGSRLGTVQVQCQAQGEALTQVRITYALTSLSDAGNRVLQALTPSAYAQMLKDWQVAIISSQQSPA